MLRPCRAQIIWGVATAGSSALQASSPAAILCCATPWRSAAPPLFLPAATTAPLGEQIFFHKSI